MGNILTPTEQISGLPLLFVPREEVLSYLHTEQGNGPVIADLNHVNHPKSSPWLRGEAGGFAVRQARGQFVLRTDHNAYHSYYSGPRLPKTRDERLRAVVLCAAGYIPAQALDFSRRRPRQVTLLDSQRERLRTSGEVRIISPGAIRVFLLRCVDQADTAHIRSAVADEFLSLEPSTEESASRRKQLAHLLLSLILEPLADPLDKAYSFGRMHGSISKEQPVHPRDFIHRQIVGPGKKATKHVVQALRTKLASERGIMIPDGHMPTLLDHAKSARRGAFLLGSTICFNNGSAQA